MEMSALFEHEFEFEEIIFRPEAGCRIWGLEVVVKHTWFLANIHPCRMEFWM
jgi:hypothetical protein